MIGNRPAKIEADKSGINLLFHILALFGVEMKQVERIFQIAERGFLSPAHMIKFLDFLQGKLVGAEIRGDAFKDAGGDFHTENAEFHGKKRVIFVGEMENGTGRENRIRFSVLYDFTRMACGQNRLNFHIKFPVVRQMP